MGSRATRPIDVLVVGADDSAVGRIRAALPAELFAVHAPNAGGAVEDAIDVVLLDLAADGQSLEHLALSHVPVVALTPPADRDAELRALEQGALDTIGTDELSGRALARALRYALDRHRLEAELQRVGHLDPLTGLHNRRYLMKHLDVAVAAARRHGHPLTLCVCDVDHFKDVNDTYGHLVGDRVLIAVAGVLSRGLRTEDVVARFGGDEFCLLLPHIDAEAARHAVERVRCDLTDLVIRPAAGVALRVSATFGTAELGPEHDDAQALFASADAALYEGKQAGRNRLEAGRRGG
jgi:two-component system cell cycle response regulator